MSPATLRAVTEAVRRSPEARALRKLFPAVHFTECSEDDVPAHVSPVADCGGYSLFLIQGASGHCIGFTTELHAATGIVVARKSGED